MIERRSVSSLVASIGIVASLFLGGCKPGLNDDCDNIGKEGECSEDNLICAQRTETEATCQAICFEQTDCPVNFDCLPSQGTSPGGAQTTCRPRFDANW